MGDGENFVGGRTRRCSKCKGDGTQRCLDCGGSGIFSRYRCTTCFGKGRATDKAAAEWKHQREAERQRKLQAEEERKKVEQAVAEAARKAAASKVVATPIIATTPKPASQTTSSNPLLGGIVGALLGWGFLFLAVKFVNSIMGSGNFFLTALAALVALANFIGFFAYPIIGFKLGAKHIFTTTRTLIESSADTAEKAQTSVRTETVQKAAAPSNPKPSNGGASSKKPESGKRWEEFSSRFDAGFEALQAASREKERQEWVDRDIEARIRYGESLVAIIGGVWLGALLGWWVGLIAAVVAVGFGELVIVSNRPD